MGQSPERLTEIAKRAIAQTATLDRSNIGHRVIVDDLSAEDAAGACLDQTSWPARHRSIGDLG